jgi:hypothetical protein
LAQRPENDPIRRRLQDTQFGGPTATLLYSWLAPEQRERLFFQHRLRLPIQSLMSGQQVVVRQAFDQVIARQYATANEQMAANPGGRVPTIKQEDLDHFGITFELSRHGGRTAASVKLGSMGRLFLAYLDNTQDFLLPAHGNPYTGAAVPKDAPLPSVRVCEAATGDIPWPDRLRKLAEGSHLPLLADYYRTPPISRPASATNSGGAPQSPVAALDALCQQDGYLWWTRNGTLLLRKRDWYQQRLREVPDRWVLRMIARLEAQNGLPSYADVLCLQELTLPQITGLYLLAEQQSTDELSFLGLSELLTLVAAAPRPQQGPLPVGDLTNIEDGDLEQRVSLIQKTLAPRQQAPFNRLVAMQPQPVPPEAMGGEFRVRCFCCSPKPQITTRGYRSVNTGIRWELHRMATPVLGYGYGAGYDLSLPLSLPDDRRAHTKIEIVP